MRQASTLGARAPPHLKKGSAQKRRRGERKFRPDMPEKKIKTKKVGEKVEKSKRKGIKERG